VGDNDAADIAAAINAYDPLAADLAPTYESFSFEKRRGDHMDLLPNPGAWILDVGSGSGTGTNAAALAARGYTVVAAEPSAGMRREAAVRHDAAAVTWLDDRLPDLTHVRALGQKFDFLLLQAVFMHLPEPARAPALATLAWLALPHAVMALSLRHGPVPPGRIMYEIPAADVIGLGDHAGFDVIRQSTGASAANQPDVTFSRLCFRRRP
jgi:SAM-dependent methyltransferase